MSYKIVIGTLCGLVVGGIGGFFVGREVERRKQIKKEEEMTDYQSEVDRYARVEHEDEEDAPERENGVMSSEKRKQMHEELKKARGQQAGMTEYHNMYREGGERIETLLAESEHPSEEFDEDGDELGTPEERAFEEHQENMNRPPKIISADDAADLPAYFSSNLLYYYTEDDTVVEESEMGEEVVDCPEMLIGDALTKYDFVNSNENIIFVLNYAQDTCYEIQKIRAAYHDEDEEY